MSDYYLADPLHVFRFKVEFADSYSGDDVPLCSGLFSEVSGLEATMEPKTIKEGGHNYGASQRAGQVSFGTVILKRGITEARNLWQWFELVNNQGKYASRMDVTITLLDGAGTPLLAWMLDFALPVKFKAPDLNATASEVGIEELHLVHEGLSVERP